VQLGPSRQAHERELTGLEGVHHPLSPRVLAVLGIAPRVRQPRPFGELDELPRRRRRAWPDHLDPDALEALNRLAAAHEGRQQQIGQWAVLDQQGTQSLAFDRDVAHRLGDHSREKDGLARQQADLAEEAGGAVTDDLLPRGVLHGRLTFENGDERIAHVADLEQRLPDRRCALLAVLGQGGELEVREDRGAGVGHGWRVVAPSTNPRKRAPRR